MESRLIEQGHLSNRFEFLSRNLRKWNVDLKPNNQPYSCGVHLSLKVSLRNLKMVVFLKTS